MILQMGMTPKDRENLARIAKLLADAKRAAKTGDRRLIRSVVVRTRALEVSTQLAELKRATYFGGNWPT
jgi:hypothetical protein